MRADLHIHTHYSDGKYTPADIFTGDTEDLIEYQGKKVSKKTIAELARLAELI